MLGDKNENIVFKHLFRPEDVVAVVAHGVSELPQERSMTIKEAGNTFAREKGVQIGAAALEKCGINVGEGSKSILRVGMAMLIPLLHSQASSLSK